MPCDSSHMEPNSRERELSKVLAFLEELRTGKLKKKHLEGYHPDVYCKSPSQKDLDDATAQLCDELQGGSIDVTTNTLELQMWWRDHQEHDAERLRREAEADISLKNRIMQLIEAQTDPESLDIEQLTEDIIEQIEA